MADIPLEDGTNMTVSTPAFRWTEKYSVNIAALDHQHQSLFATINELNEALATGEGAAVADSVLQKLVEYALTHFAAEEALMTEYEFPGFSTHCMEHQKFAESVTKLLKDYRVGKSGVPVSLLLFLQTWLKRHILVADKAYSSFLNARGVH
jgi:hemerythrin